jgi:glycine/D-amino acid oxidase-like deaminating enzyme
MPGRTPLSSDYRESCYWWDDVGPPQGLGDGNVPAAADVVVIGSGYTGMSAALESARRGRDVVVLEERTVGWGASSRNGGMVSPGTKQSLGRLRDRYGAQGEALYRSTVEGFRHLEELMAREGIDCEYERSGRISLAHRPAKVKELEAGIAVQRRLGLTARFVPRERLSEDIGSDAFHGGAVLDEAGGLHPAKLMAGLARAAIGAGAAVYEDTPALGVKRDGGGMAVRTARGTIRARDVLLATNGYTASGPFWKLRRRLVVIGSYIIATEPIEAALAKEISPRRRMFADTKYFLYYWRLSSDGTRILFGGRASLAPTTVSRARDWLYRGMVRVHPQLTGVRVGRAWGGNVALTMDLAPRLGREDGLTFSLGYSGRGVVHAVWLGHVAARWICGEEPPVYAGIPFRPVPFPRLLPLTLPVAGAYYKALDIVGPA